MGHSRELGYAVINLVKPQPAPVINDTPLCAIKQEQRRVSSPIPKQHNAAKELQLLGETFLRPSNILPQGTEYKKFRPLHYTWGKSDLFASFRTTQYGLISSDCCSFACHLHVSPPCLVQRPVIVYYNRTL